MIIGIYKITNPKGKINIGQSINIERRWDEYKRLQRCKNQVKLYNSLLKYGPENHKFEIIEECSKDDLDKRELYWGKYYDVLGKNGLNLKLGNGRGECSEETKRKISKSNKGKAGKYIRTKQIRNKTSNANSVIIYQFSLFGILIKEWKSIHDAELKYGKGIKDNLIQKIKKSHGFVWSYTNKFPGYEQNHKNRKIVEQYSKEGKLLKEWSSLTEIENILKYPNSNISSCCRGKQKTAYNFIWKFKENASTNF